jgi:polyisoprenoid-binding protein YceI
MKKGILLCSLLIVTGLIYSQDIQLTRNGKITFFSKTNVENIDAVNNEVFSSLNTKTGSIQFLVLIKSFQFKKASMQQHFNDVEYLNSTEYPKSDFKGTINEVSKVNFTKDGTYPVVVEGSLTMHGVTNKIKIDGIINVKSGKINSSSKFIIKLTDYKITVPSIVSTKVAEQVEVTVNCNYEPFKN